MSEHKDDTSEAPACAHCGERWQAHMQLMFKPGKEEGSVVCMDHQACEARRDRQDAARDSGTKRAEQMIAASIAARLQAVQALTQDPANETVAKHLVELLREIGTPPPANVGEAVDVAIRLMSMANKLLSEFRVPHLTAVSVERALDAEHRRWEERVSSGCYAPREGDPNYSPIILKLEEAYQINGGYMAALRAREREGA